MMHGVIEEAKAIVREMPGFAAVLLLLGALSVGVRCTVVYEADGDSLKLIAEGRQTMREAERMRAECPMKTPGFTVIVGLRQYGMELSVPVRSVRSLLGAVHAA